MHFQLVSSPNPKLRNRKRRVKIGLLSLPRLTRFPRPNQATLFADGNSNIHPAHHGFTWLRHREVSSAKKWDIAIETPGIDKTPRCSLCEIVSGRYRSHEFDLSVEKFDLCSRLEKKLLDRKILLPRVAVRRSGGCSSCAFSEWAVRVAMISPLVSNAREQSCSATFPSINSYLSHENLLQLFG